jgi:hypothetical protein
VAKREPKSRHKTTIQVVGRPGGRKGWIEVGTGNVVYYRSSAKTPSLQLTYQQLLALFEKEIDYIEIDERNLKLSPRPNGDFTVSVIEIEIDDSQLPLIESVSSIKKLDPRRIDSGTYQFSSDMASGRKSKKYIWFAHLSVQAALWVVHRYIEKFLVKKRSATTDEDVQVSKQEMRNILLKFYKRISS